MKTVREHHIPGLDESRTVHEIVRRQITSMVEDVILQTQSALDMLQPETIRTISEVREKHLSLSARKWLAKEKAIKAFLFTHMYRAPSVVKVREDAKKVVRDLFNAYFSGEAQMPNEWGLDWRDTAARLDECKTRAHGL